MIFSSLLSGIRRKLGTSVSDRYTDFMIFGVCEEVINFDVYGSEQMDSFAGADRVIPVFGNVALSPDDMFLFVIGDTEGIPRVPVNELDNAVKANQKAYCVKKDVDGKQKIFLSFQSNYLTLRAIEAVKVLEGTEVFPLPRIFQNAVELLTAGKILKYDQQSNGENMWQDGLTSLINAIATERKQAHNAEGWTMGSVLDDAPFWVM